MKKKVTYINIEADTTKEGKDCHVKVSTQIEWDNDYSDSVVFGSLCELFYEAEKQGFVFKSLETKQIDKEVLDTKGTLKEMAEKKKEEPKQEETKTENKKQSRWGIK